MQNFYSAKYNGFFPDYMFDAYRNAGTLPDDLKPISDDDVSAFVAGKKGYLMIAGPDGLPVWEAVPEPTHQELVAQAEAKKSAKISDVNVNTQAWQTQLMLGMITDADKASLTTWMKYLQAVQRVDTSLAPDISWPEMPA